MAIKKTFPLIIALFLVSVHSYSQYSNKAGFYFAKQFSKELSLYKAKEFVIKNVLGESTSVVKFQIDPLAAASSGELTSLVYQCPDKSLDGMVLGFYGSYWNEAGVEYTGYKFRDVPKASAVTLLEVLEKTIKEQEKYLAKDINNNNVYFKYEDITFLIYTTGTIKIRVFWEGYDSEWDMTAFKRTKKRLLNKLDD